MEVSLRYPVYSAHLEMVGSGGWQLMFVLDAQ